MLIAVVASCGDDSLLRAPDSTTTSTTPTTSGSGGSAAATTATTAGGVEHLRVEVIERRPHDPDAFTQGFELDGDVLYESTGLYGESSVRRVDPDTGDVRAQYDLPDDQFGEGLTVLDDKLVVITWREHIAYLLDTPSLDVLDTFSYDTEGWGICDDFLQLFMSDGSDTLYFRDRNTFDEIGRVQVTLEGEPVDELNELECQGGYVFANVWHTDTILRIDPESGRVSAVIDASGLLADDERSDPEAVLNGIAYDTVSDNFLLTGKRWPAMFEVRFVPA